MFSGWIKDVTGDWKISYYTTALMLLIPALLMILEPLVMPDMNNLEQDKTEKAENGPCLPTEKENRENVIETEPLFDEALAEITKHRPSKIYKAYYTSQAKTLSLDRELAPLADQESI